MAADTADHSLQQEMDLLVEIEFKVVEFPLSTLTLRLKRCVLLNNTRNIFLIIFSEYPLVQLMISFPGFMS